MLKRHFDPRSPYRCVIYLRMSTDQQNKRSPDQQLDQIQSRLKAMGYPWTIVKIYRDDGKSGRYLRKRPGYQAMMRDIKAGSVTADLILVDTIERFGRVEELPTIRKQLFDTYGVLILTADVNFDDPTSPAGKALGAFEMMRATEDGRIKAHNVLRGKRDAARQGRWPGGPVPFGFRLENVMREVNGCQEVDHRVLVPDPAKAWIIELTFKTALDNGFGQTRLARFLNSHPDIAPSLKPFQPPSVGYWLDNPIYYGELLWERNSTGIVGDTRVVERNAEEDMIRVPGFCKPIVSRETWDAVQAVRQARRERVAESRKQKKGSTDKLIAPRAPGLALKYLLTGLVRCGHCGRSMTPSPSKYITKNGAEREYTTYVCPGYIARICQNGKRVPEQWLRTVVIGKIRERLFPGLD